jgi:colicin import membrane protein
MRIAPAETSAPAETGTELAVLPALEAIVPAEFFRPSGSDAILTTLEETVMAMRAKLDISTEGGRRAIASLAYRVSRSKTALDKLREDLVRDRKVELKAIDKEGGVVWDRVEALQKKVRAELDEWENAEKMRVADHEAALTLIASIAALDRPLNLDEIESKMKLVNQICDRDWQEFSVRAAGAKALAWSGLQDGAERARQAIRQREEAERLAEEARERALKEREEAAAKAAKEAAERRAEEQATLAREAAEQERKRIEDAKFEAEAKARQAEAARVAAEAKAEADRVEAERKAQEAAERLELAIKVAEARRAQEAEEAAQRERDARERAAVALFEAQREREREAQYAEQRRVAREQEIERERKAAEEKAERDRVAAIEAERRRVADEAERVRLETEKRERNKKHRERIESAAAEGLIFRFPMQIELARDLIKAISEGLIPNVTINY